MRINFFQNAMQSVIFSLECDRLQFFIQETKFKTPIYVCVQFAHI